MKIPIKVYSPRWGRKRGVTLSLLPGILRSLGLGPGADVCAVVDHCVVILCPAEDAEAWNKILADFPAGLMGGFDGPSEESGLPQV